MRQIISYLKKFRENNLSEFVDVPKALPKCYVCDEHTHPYTRYNGVGVCEDCYSALETCIYCDNRSLNIKNGICSTCLEDSASVQSYGHKPEPLFHRAGRHERPYLTHESYSKGNPVLHYGIEIEMDLERSQQDSPDIHAESNKFASFVNLNNGEITWFNGYRRSFGDVRDLEGAKDTVNKLFEEFPG